MERVSEITFNASLLREYRAIDFVNRMLAEKRLDPKRYRHNRLHRIEAGKALAATSGATKLDTSWRFFQELHRAGHRAGKTWLTEHFDDIGVQGDARSQEGVHVSGAAAHAGGSSCVLT